MVQSFNDDKPYDQFVNEQLAGDEIDPNNETYLVASGFNRLGPLRKNAGNQDVASSRNEVLTEMTNIVGAAFLGVTVGLRPLPRPQVRSVPPVRLLPAAGASSRRRSRTISCSRSKEEQDAWKAKAAPVQQEIAAAAIADAEGAGRRKGADLRCRSKTLDDKMPRAPAGHLHREGRPEASARRSTCCSTAITCSTAAKVGRAAARDPAAGRCAGRAASTIEKPRLKARQWIVDPANPLTARVMVNRIWQYHFGRGIVATPNDFGRMGARPIESASCSISWPTSSSKAAGR